MCLFPVYELFFSRSQYCWSRSFISFLCSHLRDDGRTKKRMAWNPFSTFEPYFKISFVITSMQRSKAAFCPGSFISCFNLCFPFLQWMGVSGFLPDVCLWPAKPVFAGRRRCLLNQNRRMGLVSFFIRFPLLGGAAAAVCSWKAVRPDPLYNL